MARRLFCGDCGDRTQGRSTSWRPPVVLRSRVSARTGPAPLDAAVDVTYRRRVPVTNLRRTLIDLADEQTIRAAERIHGFDREKLVWMPGRRKPSNKPIVV